MDFLDDPEFSMLAWPTAMESPFLHIFTILASVFLCFSGIEHGSREPRPYCLLYRLGAGDRNSAIRLGRHDRLLQCRTADPY